MLVGWFEKHYHVYKPGVVGMPEIKLHRVMEQVVMEESLNGQLVAEEV